MFEIIDQELLDFFPIVPRVWKRYLHPLDELRLHTSIMLENSQYYTLCWGSIAVRVPFLLASTTSLHSSSLRWNITSWVKPSMKSQIRLYPILLVSLLFFFTAVLWIPWGQELCLVFLFIPRAWHSVRSLLVTKNDICWIELGTNKKMEIKKSLWVVDIACQLGLFPRSRQGEFPRGPVSRQKSWSGVLLQGLPHLLKKDTGRNLI